MGAPSVVGSIVVFVILAVVFGALERVFPAIPQASIFRRERRADYVYWLFSPLVTQAIARVALGVTVVLLALAVGLRGPGRDVAEQLVAFVQARSPIARQPRGLQLVEALLVADLLGYWSHRLFHRGRLWRFHAVHHGSKTLDWLAAARVHPVNDVVSKLLTALPLLLLGFDLRVLAGAVPILTLYAIFVHANVPWGFGPLRYVIATPLFHRWHHTSQDEGLDKNFAGLFPFYDMLFGTFYLPDGRQPTRFGLAQDDVPQGFPAQLAYPFRRSPGAPPGRGR